MFRFMARRSEAKPRYSFLDGAMIPGFDLEIREPVHIKGIYNFHAKNHCPINFHLISAQPERKKYCHSIKEDGIQFAGIANLTLHGAWTLVSLTG